jgi:hypothetical protein
MPHQFVTVPWKSGHYFFQVISIIVKSVCGWWQEVDVGYIDDILEIPIVCCLQAKTTQHHYTDRIHIRIELYESLISFTAHFFGEDT